MSMRYRELVQFEPIDSVIQLLDANRPDAAKKLISSYVISDEMAARIADVMIPQLSFDSGVDHMGVLIVGNYGTGKSHLMSVLSLVAENAEYLPLVQHSRVVEAAGSIAGKFKVHRIEISSKKALRDIITEELQVFLEGHGVSYEFPSADKVTNSKAAFEEMMAAFEEVHPNHGILFVVDEFLDYLRSRKGPDLTFDLSFLREIGEVSKHLRFRFVAGVQEALFDSGRFEHVADSLRRVKDRFTQILLVRQDVSFVVAERLLKKSADQQSKIRDYLTPFAKFYGSMNERMDDYVRLFPVHPDYIGTFEQLLFAENRGALVTLRDQIEAILDDEVPDDRPGLICYDQLWQTVKSNQVLRADQQISPVLKVSDVLSERVDKAFTRPAYKPMALRIIAGLSVHRLTTGGDIEVPIGPTAEELRDALCLFQPGIDDMGGDPEANLLSQVQTVLRETVKTVNGQFISKAPDTEQYYLDLKKDIDYDAQIEKRAESLSDDALDRAYYSAISELMELTDEASYVTGHQIWQYQVEWQDRRVERDGYLFFGAPNERPTAQPERDFYIYFVQPFEPPRFKDEHKADEVFLRLKGLDDSIRHHLSLYAAARDLASTASGSARSIYFDKAKGSLRDMSKWLQEQQMSAYEVTYQGKAKSLQEWSTGISFRDKARLGPDERINFRDVVIIVSGLALSNRFAEAAPEYPSFSALVTESNRQQLVGHALRAIAGETLTKDAAVILDGLEMLDGDRIDPIRSRYAKEVLSLLNAKGHGKVLNRGELLSGDTDLEFFSPLRFRLEPDLLVIVLGGLVYSGDIVVAITGDKIGSGKISELAVTPLADLESFKHIEAPKEIDVAVVRSLFEMLGLPRGLAKEVVQGSAEPVKRLQEEVSKLTRRLLEAKTDMLSRTNLWGQPLLSEDEADDRRAKLEALGSFTESLTPFNTVGKLKNLHISSDDIATQKSNLEVLGAIEQIQGFVDELGRTASYLSQALTILPPDHDWVQKAQGTREQLLDKLAGDRTGKHGTEYQRILNQLKKDYIAAYAALHGKSRLGVDEEQSKAALLKDSRLVSLRVLAGISILPTNQLTTLEESLDKLKGCSSFVNSVLESSPACPHCDFRAANEQGELLPSGNVLKHVDEQLDRLLASWTQTLVENLEDPVIQSNLELLNDSDRKIVTSFADSRTLSDDVSPKFVAAVQEALSGLEKIVVTGEDIKEALLQGGSPASPEALRKRFDTLLNNRCRGKDTAKLRFVVD